MKDKDERVTPQEMGALGVGVLVTIASSVLTSLVSPILFPFNIFISLGLGVTAGYGALKVLDPRTGHDLLDAQIGAEYQQKLQAIAQITERTSEAGESLSQISPDLAERLGHIARMSRMITDRYKEGTRDFTGVSALLLILQRFDEILAHYLKVKRGELFMDEDQKVKKIAEVEMHVIPMLEEALETLGKKLDAGEVIKKDISKGTLEDMLQTLNLIKSLSDQISSTSKKGDSR